MEALLYDKLEHHDVKCKVCNYYCVIKENHKGICGVRKNEGGILIAQNYGKSIGNSIDPIEKKPLYHFLPKTMTYSFAGGGCNFDCPWCQNYDISQSPRFFKEMIGRKISIDSHIEYAKRHDCPSISYTYTEPTIFIEYALDVMKLATQNNIKNIWVTNGDMSSETLDLIIPYLDAVNIDYKGTSKIYQKHRLGDNLRVLENMKKLIDSNIHVEVTTLLIPEIDIDAFKEIAVDLSKYIPLDTPWHITRFFPAYKMNNDKPTSLELMYKAYEIAQEVGFKKIHLGNI